MRDLSFVLVGIVVFLWLAATGRLANVLSVLVGTAPKKNAAAPGQSTPSATQNPISTGVQLGTGWEPTDGRRFDPNLNATFSNIRGQPLRGVAGNIDPRFFGQN